MKQLIETVQYLQKKGSELKSLNESIDTGVQKQSCLNTIVLVCRDNEFPKQSVHDLEAHVALDDLIRDQNELQHHTHSMCLWPKQWTAYPNRVPCTWQQCRLVQANKATIPEGPGVYTLVIASEVAGHPQGSYLMYVGKANSLRKRFGDYLTKERREGGRPKIFRLLNMYDPHIWFCYTEAPLANITTLEDDLTEAFIPPCNDSFPATIRPVVGAF